MKSLIPLVATAALLAACGGDRSSSGGAGQSAEAPAEGPAVSSSEAPRNAAVDTTPTTGDTGQTPGANSFTEDQARGAIEKAGYAGVTDLRQNEQGLWTATATKDGKSAQVSLDYRGAVVSR